MHPGRHLLLSLLQQRTQLTYDVLVLVVEEAGGLSQVPDTTSTTDPMHILLNVRGKVKVDDVLNVRDVETSGSNL